MGDIEAEDAPQEDGRNGDGLGGARPRGAGDDADTVVAERPRAPAGLGGEEDGAAQVALEGIEDVGVALSARCELRFGEYRKVGGMGVGGREGVVNE